MSARLEARFPALAGKNVHAVIWTTTPWTLPANLALAFHPDAEYGFYPVEGTSDVLLLAKAVKDSAVARWSAKTNLVGPPKALLPPVAEIKGAELEHVRFRHPWIDRDSPGVLGDYVTLEACTGVVHTARPRLGRLPDWVRDGLEIFCPWTRAGS